MKASDNKEIKVFISYSHNDTTHRTELEKWLKPLRRNGKISSWSDREIIPGEEWDSRINEELEHADIIVLLVSQDFLASDYSNDIEVNKALYQHNTGQSIVIPVLLRPCDFEEAVFAKLQATPIKDGRLKPIVMWDVQEEAWSNVILDIKKAASNIRRPTLSFNFDNYARYVGIKNGQKRWDWKVFMDEEPETLEIVKSVRYQLHETWPVESRIHTVTNRKSKFAFRRNGWGTFRIGISVTLNDGTVVDTYHDLSFQKPWQN